MASSLPPLPPRTTLPSKHTRTNSSIDLPAYKRKKAPSIKPSNAFLFKGMHPLYSRHAIDTRHDMMEIRCTQPNCRDFEYKEVNRSLNSTNNYKAHYRKFHPGIALNERDHIAKIEAKAARDIRAGVGVGFFEKPVNQQTHNQRYRNLLLEFVIKNNLSFSLVDKPETKALFSFLSPSTKQIPRKILMGDLKARYEAAEIKIRDKCQDHIQSGGRFALTTDGWAGNNKLDYIAVTGHSTTHDFKSEAILLDIIELVNPVHDGAYLCEKLLEVTDRLGITCSIISITRDNASPNDTMLAKFEDCVKVQYEALDERDKVHFCCKFNRKDGDVRCCAHIYNIAVQAGKLYTNYKDFS
jgi:hypothetical protein